MTGKIPLPLRVLVVDDDKILNRTLEFKLKNAGFFTDFALDGEEALRLVKKEKFDLILLDLVMPNMNGFDFLRELRKMGIGTPVAVMSKLGQEGDIERANEFGVKDYFVKSASYVDDIVKYVEKMSVS